MAFHDLKPVSVNDSKNGKTYIIGNVFAVYNAGPEPPVVYTWDMVKQVSVGRKEIKIDAGRASYSFSNKHFRDVDDNIRAIAIIECRYKEFGFNYQHERRMFPLKSLYNECSPGKEVYVGEAVLDEGETAAAFIALLNFKLMKFLWLVAILIMLVTIGILHLNIGITRNNMLYFIPISAAAGGITALLVYIITHAVARGMFKRLCETDISARNPITFVISRSGFAACASCVYESRDLIPWSEMDYFIESDKMFIIYKNNSPVAYIPKKAFEKKMVSSIADIIALSLEQR